MGISVPPHEVPPDKNRVAASISEEDQGICQPCGNGMIPKQRIPVLKMLTVGLLPSPLKVWYYRMRGAKIGADVSIGPLSVVIAKQELEIGEGTHIGFCHDPPGAFHQDCCAATSRLVP